jgi:hypothetical protein
MGYRLRTLLILLAAGPPLLAGAWFYSNIFWVLAVSLGTIFVAEAAFQVLRLMNPEP